MANQKRRQISQQNLRKRVFRLENKRGPYKAKNRLDGFLRFALPIKYKWRRYEIYKEFLRQKGCCSDAQIEDIVADRMKNGVNGENYQATLDGLSNWLKECRKKRAQYAAAVRHKKSKNNR